MCAPTTSSKLLACDDESTNSYADFADVSSRATFSALVGEITITRAELWRESDCCAVWCKNEACVIKDNNNNNNNDNSFLISSYFNTIIIIIVFC